MNKYHFCASSNCGTIMVRAEWITGDYCWGCRAVLGKNWVKLIEENKMESMSEKLKDLQERKSDAFAILSAVSGFSEERIKEIADGAEMSVHEKITLEGLAEAT